ncbi:hypothetical protein COO60DRAFT_1692746 [Scenedesmus sp. NREL 46B-D3]|nr:hypothetical protein COO60DRAFT_1692746 [Scenedesmus sp. NREL 46B-D3]
MKSLELSGCGLQGTLPKAWGNWVSLEALYLGQYDSTGTFVGPSSLIGTIPASFANMRNLRFLDVSENSLTGQLPPEFGSAELMPIDSVFYLGYQDLRGTIPLSWSYFSLGLVDVTATRINVTCIPDGLNVFKGRAFNASGCSGSSPQVNAVATLRSLDAAALQLSGELPATLATFSRLEHLDLSGNKAVKGSLPSIWAALVALRTLDISSTGISGSLPASWASLQKLRAFRAADCSGLSGPLPLEWGMLKSLEELVVINSQLSGPLPAWTDAEMLRAASTAALATAQQAVDQAVNEDLVVASVQQRVRYISGAVSPQAVVEAASCAASALQSALAAAPASTRFMPLRIINLSGNNLSGQLVPNWSLFEQLQMLILASNSMSGPLPDAFTRLTTLRALDLSSNSFAGQLPSTWVSMRQLVFLDVSSNALVGPIPETLPFMAGDGFNLRCLVLFGNAGLTGRQLTELKSRMETDSRGRVRVVVGSNGRTCDISVLDQ